jgi:hypothetical protein
MLAVMAVIVILGSLLIPSLRGLSPTFNRDGAVDSVRGAWATARARAVAEGRPYRFAVVPGTGHFRVAPDLPEYWSGSGPSAGDHGQPPAYVRADSLPKGVSFSEGDAPAGAPSASGGGGNNATPSPSSYSNPIVFLPDGTARQDAEVHFHVRGAKPARLTLRGLTGVSTVHRGSKKSQHPGGGR